MIEKDHFSCQGRWDVVVRQIIQIQYFFWKNTVFTLFTSKAIVSSLLSHKQEV